jgi:hypothetical protein
VIASLRQNSPSGRLYLPCSRGTFQFQLSSFCILRLVMGTSIYIPQHLNNNSLRDRLSGSLFTNAHIIAYFMVKSLIILPIRFVAPIAPELPSLAARGDQTPSGRTGRITRSARQSDSNRISDSAPMDEQGSDLHRRLQCGARRWVHVLHDAHAARGSLNFLQSWRS